MRPILHLSRTLIEEPTVAEMPGVVVRTLAGESDIDRWLELRDRAFAGQSPGVRPWTRADFSVEFLGKPWWSPERMWFAEANDVVGSVTLAVRGHQATVTPVVHWLMVLPEWRRRGVGELLVNALEAACWKAGYRRVALETHTGWSAAEAFYRALGYRQE